MSKLLSPTSPTSDRSKSNLQSPSTPKKTTSFNVTSPNGVTSPVKNSPLNNFFANRMRAKSNPVPPAGLGILSSPSTSNATSPTTRRRLSISSPTSDKPKPEGKKERLHIIFRLFDKDQDEKLNPEELHEFLGSVFYPSQTKDLLAVIQENYKDGIAFDEFVELCKDEKKATAKGRGRSYSTFAKPSLSPKTIQDEDEDVFNEEDLKIVFTTVLDANEDGVVSLNEFRRVIVNLGLAQTFSDEELNSLFDGSKTLNFEQFRKLVMM